MTTATKINVITISIICAVIVLVIAPRLPRGPKEAISQAQKTPQNDPIELTKTQEKAINSETANHDTKGYTDRQERTKQPRCEEIEIADYVKEKLIDLMRESAKTVPVNATREEEDRKQFRTFVAVSMDLGKAEKYINRRFSRVNYFRELEGSYIRRTLSEELGPDGEIIHEDLEPEAMSEAKSEGPVRLHYHEGPNYMEFEIEKEERPITGPVSTEEAIQMVSAYVDNMQLVTETSSDRIASIDVDRAVINEEIPGTDGEGRDFTVQQSVNLRREYEGLPVINSTIRISFNPDTNELIQVAKRYWSALAEENEATVKGQSSVEEAVELSNKVQKELIDTIANDKPVRDGKAEVRDVNRVYFQTEEGLKPILYFTVNYSHQTAENGTQTRPGVVLMDPY